MAYITLPAAPVPNISTNVQDASPSGSATGKITITATGGTPPYWYALNNESYSTNTIYTGLTAGSYTVKVRDAQQCVRTVTVIVSEGCGKPTGLTTLLAGTTTTTVGWNTVVGATRYVVRYKEVGGFLTITRYRNSPNIGLTGLKAGKQYEVTVWAECGGQLSDPSDLFYFSTLNPRLHAENTRTPLLLYPNPNQGEFSVTLALPDSRSVRLAVLDYTGKQIYNYNTAYLDANTEYTFGLQLNTLTTGIYFLRAITADETVYTLRFWVK